jgi:hypothetical protein
MNSTAPAVGSGALGSAKLMTSSTGGFEDMAEPFTQSTVSPLGSPEHGNEPGL